MNYAQYHIEQLNKALLKQVEEVFIEALKLWGFEFENRAELEGFILERCSSAEMSQTQERFYMVDNEPFLVWKRETNFVIKTDERTITASADLGQFRFIHKTS